MLKSKDIITFLKENPNFIDENIDALSDDHNLNDTASPFVSRQLSVLKQREREQQAKIDFIVKSAKHNQKLEADLLTLAIRFLSNKQPEDPVTFACAVIQRQFDIKQVALLLDTEKDMHHPAYDEVQQRVMHKESVCDDRVSSQLLSALFPEDYQDITSCAFVPLVFEDTLNGVIILASHSASRFQPGVGVIYLDRLGRLIAGYLQGKK